MDLKTYLKENCINKAEFARKLGVNYTTLYNIVFKKSYPYQCCVACITVTDW